MPKKIKDAREIYILYAIIVLLLIVVLFLFVIYLSLPASILKPPPLSPQGGDPSMEQIENLLAAPPVNVPTEVTPEVLDTLEGKGQRSAPPSDIMDLLSAPSQ